MGEHKDSDIKIAEAMAECVFDPLKHVAISYPWNTDRSIQTVPWHIAPGIPHPDSPIKSEYLKRFPHLLFGPDQWQCEELDVIGQAAKGQAKEKDANGNANPLRVSVVSGHGIGKSTISAWLCKWILDTRPYSVGTMTANTSSQLRTKTWAEVGKWHHLSLTRDWFRYVASTTTMSLTYDKDKDLSGRWKCFAQTCDPTNSEAFAGQHSDSTSFYIFDESSKIADKLFEVREGGMAGGEPMCFDFGNGTRNTGRFYENCVGKFRYQYIVRSVDSREAYRVNKRKVQEDLEAHGEDSDYFRVRWRGLFPGSGDVQFIDSNELKEAMERNIAVSHKEDPLVLGVDVARMGDDESIIYPRVGYDCRSFEPRRFRKMDGEELANEVAQYVNEFRQLGMRTRAIFVDEGGGYGGSVVDNLRRMGYQVTGVNPGERAVNRKTYALRIDEMWGGIRDNLKHLMMPGPNTPEGEELFEQLTQREFGHTMKEQVRLEPKSQLKERIGKSPDIADALAFTFAKPIFSGSGADSTAAFIRYGS